MLVFCKVIEVYEWMYFETSLSPKKTRISWHYMYTFTEKFMVHYYYYFSGNYWLFPRHLIIYHRKWSFRRLCFHRCLSVHKRTQIKYYHKKLMFLKSTLIYVINVNLCDIKISRGWNGADDFFFQIIVLFCVLQICITSTWILCSSNIAHWTSVTVNIKY